MVTAGCERALYITIKQTQITIAQGNFQHAVVLPVFLPDLTVCKPIQYLAHIKSQIEIFVTIAKAQIQSAGAAIFQSDIGLGLILTPLFEDSGFQHAGVINIGKSQITANTLSQAFAVTAANKIIITGTRQAIAVQVIFQLPGVNKIKRLVRRWDA